MAVVFHYRVRRVADDLLLKVHALGYQERDHAVPCRMTCALGWVDAGNIREVIEVLGVLFAFDGGSVRATGDEAVVQSRGCGHVVPCQEGLELWDDGDDPAELAFRSCQGVGAHQWADVIVGGGRVAHLGAETCTWSPLKPSCTHMACRCLLNSCPSAHLYTIQSVH